MSVYITLTYNTTNERVITLVITGVSVRFKKKIKSDLTFTV